MLPDDPDAAYLWDMLEAAKQVVRFVDGIDLARFQNESMIRSAVERQIEIIGEAARHVSDALRKRTPQIPWRPMIAQRNILAHEYGAI